MKTVFKNVHKKIKPEDLEIRENKEMFLKIKNFINDKYKINAKMMGSVAKETFLKGDKDLDIFIFFPLKMPKDELEKKGLEIGKSLFNHFKGEYVIEYAEHPYTKGKIKNFDIEIVPAYVLKDTSQLKSAVDRTPFHTEYVKKNLKNKDDVLLLKKFLKGIECYGSDLKTQGFSGYLCELLVIKYSSILGVLESAQKWRYMQAISLENKINVKNIRKTFRDQPLIFIDPTDKNRNVAAVLSEEKMAKFIFHARKFMEKPLECYFFKKPRKINKKQILKDIKNQGRTIIAISFKKPKVIEDILYPQLRRFQRMLTKNLENNDFKVLDSWAYGDTKCGIGLEILTDTLPKYKKMLGPRIFNDVNFQEEFIKKHGKVWFEGSRFFAEIKREHKTLDKFLKHLLKENLKDKGVPTHIADSIERGFDIVRKEKLGKVKSREFWNGLNKEKIESK